MAMTWDPKLSVGVRTIDDQHKELFRRVNALLQAMEQGKGQDVLAELLGFLKQYVVEHFAAEQKLMARYRYPDAAAHEAQHERFVGDFLNLLAAFEKGGATLSLSLKLNTAVCAWLRQHIGSTDRALGQFLRAQGAAAARP